MIRSTVADWDSTAANNTDVGGIIIAENCPAQNINNALREMMAQIKAWANTAILTIATKANLWSLTNNAVIVTPKTIGDAAALVPLTDGATIAIDQAQGFNFSLTLGGSRTLQNITNAKPGTSGAIIVRQDSTGGRTLAFGNQYIAMQGVTALNMAAGAVSVIYYLVESPTSFIVTVVKS